MSEPEPTTDEPVIRPIVDFIAELRRGAVANEMSEAMHELIAAVQDTRKPGSITLTIKASIQKNHSALSIADVVTKKIPTRPRPESLWFVDANGNPTRSDPSQLEFEGIRVVPSNPITIGKAKKA
ncbi:hypothetical protein ACFXG4_27340 [Nocardia sp. NPDC059246]|uniref:hypothetical protein n=1 Tax=unclassified Nocardia TaxID=2637762 RepID=UPI0036CB27F2